MEKINNSNTYYENPTNILISSREPFNRNTLWIYPKEKEVEFRIFNKGWKVLCSTEDKGLSSKSLQEVANLLNNSRISIIEIIKKQVGKLISNTQHISTKENELQKKVQDLENKIDKLMKMYSNLVNKINGK